MLNIINGLANMAWHVTDNCTSGVAGSAVVPTNAYRNAPC